MFFVICSQFERPKREMFKKKHHLSKIYRKSIEHLSNINGTSIDVYRCPCIPMDVDGCPRISDESRKSQISHPSNIENLIIRLVFFPSRPFFFPCSGPTVADNNVFGCIFPFFFFSRLWWPTKSHMLPLV